MKRVVLFLVTNLAVMIVLSIVTDLLGINQALAANGLNVGALLAFAAVVGFGGAFISLLVSKPMAKWSTGAVVIETPRNDNEAWLLATVKRLADKAGIAMPEVAMYEGEPTRSRPGPSAMARWSPCRRGCSTRCLARRPRRFWATRSRMWPTATW